MLHCSVTIAKLRATVVPSDHQASTSWSSGQLVRCMYARPSCNAGLGPVTLAAHTVVKQIVDFCMALLGSFSTVAQALAASSLGRVRAAPPAASHPRLTHGLPPDLSFFAEIVRHVHHMLLRHSLQQLRGDCCTYIETCIRASQIDGPQRCKEMF